MAIDRNTRYPGRFDAPTTARPQGAFKNRSAPGAKDGSYLERDWANDWDGFFGSLMRSAGLTANGTPDTALASQYFSALQILGLKQATESSVGVLRVSTFQQALTGDDDTTVMTPLKVRNAIDLTGSVVAFLTNSAPPGFLKGNGAAISRSVYSRLFAKIGTMYGAGDGSTTFNLPDLRAEFLRGFDDGRGIDTGRVIGSKQIGSLISYDPTTVSPVSTGLHSIASDASTRADLGLDVPESSGLYPNADVISGNGTGTFSILSAAGVARPRNIALLFCIKF